jgi:hypothetical protein
MNNNKNWIKMIAKVCHETNNAYRETIGEKPSPKWEETSDDQRNSMIDGVKNIIDGIITTPEKNHEAWIETKINQGWKKENESNMIPFKDLPYCQQFKDHLFMSIVKCFLSNYGPVTLN